MTSITRARKAKRSVLFTNSMAPVSDPPHAWMAAAASMREAPVFCETMPHASETGIWRKGTAWQRDTMVGSTLSKVRPNMMITTPAGGSSRVFRKALAAWVPRRSARSMM